MKTAYDRCSYIKVSVVFEKFFKALFSRLVTDLVISES